MTERDSDDLLSGGLVSLPVGAWAYARVKLKTKNRSASIMVFDLHRVEPYAYNIISKEFYAHRNISNRAISHTGGNCAVELLRIIVRRRYFC